MHVPVGDTPESFEQPVSRNCTVIALSRGYGSSGLRCHLAMVFGAGQSHRYDFSGLGCHPAMVLLDWAVTPLWFFWTGLSPRHGFLGLGCHPAISYYLQQ